MQSARTLARKEINRSMTATPLIRVASHRAMQPRTSPVLSWHGKSLYAITCDATKNAAGRFYLGLVVS